MGPCQAVMTYEVVFTSEAQDGACGADDIRPGLRKTCRCLS